MIDKDLQREILESIELTGNANSIDHKIMNCSQSISDGSSDVIFDMSTGRPRIKASAVRGFKLIVSQPLGLLDYDKQQIRCCFCNKIIKYPAWHYSLKFSGKILEFFVCFNPESNTKVDTHCIKGV